MGKKSTGSKVQVVDYYASAHYGICHGPIDSISGIWINDKVAWLSHNNQLGWNIEGAIGFANTELFGGVKEQGGVAGEVYVYLGTADQVMHEDHAKRFGLTSATCPAYRGVASAFFTGPQHVPGLTQWGGPEYNAAFYWGANNTTVPPVGLRCSRMSKGLKAEFGTIQPGSDGGSSGYWQGTFDIVRNLKGNGFAWGIQHWKWIGTGDGSDVDKPQDDNGQTAPDGGYCVTSQHGEEIFATCISTAGEDDSGLYPNANGAHMIYECLTDTDWGMGASDVTIDLVNFNAVAETFYNEGAGLSALWTKQASIEDFVTEILDHVQAMLFVHPRTGKWTLKPIRADYDPAACRLVTPDNASLSNAQRKALSECTNEIVVTWTNPVNEKETSATFQDLAGIATVGTVISDSRNYYMVRDKLLATRWAARDARTAAAPLFGCTLDLDRSFWDIVPGDVLRLHWPERQIDSMLVRVGKVDYGKPGQPRISADVTEDVFALEPASFTAPPESASSDASSEPRNLAYATVFTIPYPVLAGIPDLPVNAGDNYPGVYAGLLGAQIDRDTFSFEMTGTVTQANGTQADEVLGTKNLAGHTFLSTALVAEAASTLLFGSVTGGSGPRSSGLVMIGEGDTAELCMVDVANPDGSWTLARGIFDTVPRAWPELTPMWFINDDFNAADPVERTVGEVVTYRMQSRTSKGLLALDAAEPEVGTLTDRPYLPFRPANVLVGGTAFGTKAYTTNPDSVTVSWSTRNRTMEDAVIRRWTEEPVQPEAGQTTTVRVLAEDGLTVLTEKAGLDGSSLDLVLADFNGASASWIEVTSIRDGFESLQAVRVKVTMPGAAGYGVNYGYNYGGSE